MSVMPHLAAISGLQPSRSCSLSNLIDINNHLNNKSKVKSNWSLLAKRALNIEKCVNLLKNPNEDTLLPLAKRLCQLRHQFLESNQLLDEFINEQNGIDLLFDILRKSESVAQPSFVWAYLQLEVISCLRIIMESPVGIERIISPNNEYADKLATALNTNNCTVKKQIFELLSALCVYNKDGHYKCIQALQHYQALQRKRYRFQVLVEELKSAKNVDYKTSLMAFINCLIISADNVKKRIEIRNEMIGLKLLDIISSMKREAEGGDLSIQCDVFDEQRISDENMPPDVNSHQDIFYTILRQISGNTQFETPFLHLLQHLLRIEYNNNDLSAAIWDSAETLVHRATTLIECKEDAEKLLRLHQKRRASCDALGNGPVGNGLTITQTTNHKINSNSHENSTNKSSPPAPPPPPPPPPLPPPPMAAICAPPPPPIPPHMSNNGSSHSQANNFLSLPLFSTPEIAKSKCSPVNSCNGSPVLSRKLPQQEIPKPKAKMKSINWCKIPSQKVVSTVRPNIWSIVATQHESDISANVDFNELEDLFCQPSNSSAPNSCPGSPRLPRRPVSSEISASPYNSLERKVIKRQSGEYQTPNELALLDGKKSLNVNIFLKQYRGSTDEIVNMISDGKHKEIGAERLRNLLKILPEPNEIEMLKNNEEESHRMPIAEKFLFNLIKIPNYKLKIEGMLLKEEFESNVAYLEPAIEAVRNAANELKQSKALHEILYLILVSGNFLNSGGYAGDAAGFKMMSLLKLPDIRANKPGVSLIHYVAMQAEKKGLINFAQELPSLEEASKVSIENLRIEVNSLSSKISRIKDQLSKHENDSSLHKEMNDFLISSEQEVKKLTTAIESHLSAIRIEMAEFLCEDLEHFKLEECFRIFSSFCHRFKLAVDENERRRENEIKLEARKSNSQLKKNWPNSTNSSEIENFSTENNLTQGMASNVMSNSMNGITVDQKLKRRSRRSSQDDELHTGLLEFLKTANDLGNNDIPIFGGSFRRMGSGRRSRSSNPMLDQELSSRERNTSESNNKIKQKSGESDVKNEDFVNHNKSNTNLSDAESDDESHNKKHNFNRFSPLRKTFNVKPTELESKLTKRLNDLRSNSIVPKSDTNNNHIEDIKFENNHNNDNNNNDKFRTDARIATPTELRQFWGAKENNNNIENSKGMTRPSTLHLSNHHSQQPTAVISPTKQVRNADEENTTLLSPNLTIESDLGNRSSRLPRRTSNTSPSTVTAAAIVAPILVKITSSERESSSLPLKSKLPVRKNTLTRLPQQRKTETNTTSSSVRSAIPIASRMTTPKYTMSRPSTSRGSSDIPQVRTYRSPSTVSRTNLTSDMGSVASMRRSSQLLPANRSFMKQTSASAAKTRSYMKY